MKTRNEEEINKIKDEILNFQKIRGFEEVEQKFKKFVTETKLPTRGSKYSAGYDFYSKEEVYIEPGKQHMFFTDVKSYMLYQEVLEIYIRSSIGIKKNLILKNLVGIIDQDYYSNPDNDGNIIICLKNIGEETQKIEIGERIAQGIFKNFLIADNISSQELNERIGGIGSTNK